MKKRILALAIPNIISNISVPLLSIADTAIAGRMPNASSLGAVAMASTVVSFTFWLWGFLRMATTGFTAQAYGRGDAAAQGRQLSAGSLIALVGGLAIITISPLISRYLGFLGDGSPELLPEARTYLEVAYLGAPAALMLFVLNAWFIGMQNTVVPMAVTIGSNVLNIGSSFALVYYGGMGVEGIAWGTVLAQYAAVLVLISIALLRYRAVFRDWQWRDLLSAGEFFSYIHIAGWLIMRTLMLGSISLFFVKAGSAYGGTTVSANTLLMQLFLCFSYFMDGFAYAGEALTGRYVGARDGEQLRTMLRSLLGFGLFIALLVAGVYALWSSELLALLSDKEEVLTHALGSLAWVSLIPLASFLAFLWDGVFVGMTQSKPMMQAVSLAFVTFFAVYFAMRSQLGEQALWLAFVAYLTVRSACATLLGHRLVRTFAAS